VIRTYIQGRWNGRVSQAFARGTNPYGGAKTSLVTWGSPPRRNVHRKLSAIWAAAFTHFCQHCSELKNTGWSKSLYALDSVYRTIPTNWWFEDGHHRTLSECVACCTEENLRGQGSECQYMSEDWRGTLWTLLVTFCIIIISVINQLDAQKFCFTISLFHASTCFEHMCSSSGG